MGLDVYTYSTNPENMDDDEQESAKEHHGNRITCFLKRSNPILSDLFDTTYATPDFLLDEMRNLSANIEQLREELEEIEPEREKVKFVYISFDGVIGN